jgi:glutathione S-transferase
MHFEVGVSRHIPELEDELGVELFVRAGKHLATRSDRLTWEPVIRRIHSRPSRSPFLEYKTMANALFFYTNPMSRGRIVRWMLEELGQPYRTELLDYGTTMKAPAYLAINPMGKVPALKHGDVVVTECAAICTYLADAFPESALAPAPTDSDRGAYYRWMFFGAGPLEAAVTNKSLGFEIAADQFQLQGRAGYGSLTRVLDTLSSALDGRDHLVGNQFSAADLYISAQLGWGMQFGTVESRPNFERYVALHHNRVAAQRAAQIDDDLMNK